MPKATIVKVDGSEIILDHRPTLKEAQETVGGYIEFAKGRLSGKAVILVVDKEGLYKGKPVNPKATTMYNWTGRFPIPDSECNIVGDVIVLEGWKTVGG